MILKGKELLKLHVLIDSGEPDDYIPLFYKNRDGDILCQWNDSGDIMADTDIYLLGDLKVEPIKGGKRQ